MFCHVSIYVHDICEYTKYYFISSKCQISLWSYLMHLLRIISHKLLVITNKSLYLILIDITTVSEKMTCSKERGKGIHDIYGDPLIDLV